MRRCVAYNDLWPWPTSSRPFNHDIAIKLLKYGTSCHVRSTASTVLDGFFPYLAQMITRMRGCVMHNDLWPRPGLCNKNAKIWRILLCLLYSMYILDGFSPWYWWSLAWEGVSRNHVWPWPISSKLFNCDIAYFIDYIHMWHKYNPWGDNVSHIISWPIGQRSRSHRSFEFSWS